MGIPASDPRHPIHAFVKPVVAGERRFAERAARNPRVCAECGLLDRHRDVCPLKDE